ncbi:MAG TPA: class I SAM-dependent methyltransferase [Bacteroidales bacterium]|nr:class I SAM-dependent methyltransferase [Bacteroidales bacterium]
MKRIIRTVLNIFPRPWLIRFSYVFVPFAAVLYQGNKVECPVCGGKFSKFLPYGYNRVRENVLCPGCLSLERHRLLWLYMKDRTGVFTEKLKVLHIAPEQCFYKRFRNMKNLTYVTADLESPLADVKLDVQDMPFGDGEFDVVICNHVLEHVPDDRKALLEIYRVLKTGGFALLQVPTNYGVEKTYEDASVTDPSDREKHFRQKDHYRLYGRDYLDRIRKTGFVINEDNYLLGIDEEKRQRFRLPEMEYMYGYYKG